MLAATLRTPISVDGRTASRLQPSALPLARRDRSRGRRPRTGPAPRTPCGAAKGSIHHAASAERHQQRHAEDEAGQPPAGHEDSRAPSAQMTYQGQTWLTAENRTAAMTAMAAFCRLVMVGDQNADGQPVGGVQDEEQPSPRCAAPAAAGRSACSMAMQGIAGAQEVPLADDPEAVEEGRRPIEQGQRAEPQQARQRPAAPGTAASRTLAAQGVRWRRSSSRGARHVFAERRCGQRDRRRPVRPQQEEQPQQGKRDQRDVVVALGQRLRHAGRRPAEHADGQAPLARRPSPRVIRSTSRASRSRRPPARP